MSKVSSLFKPVNVTSPITINWPFFERKKINPTTISLKY